MFECRRVAEEASLLKRELEQRDRNVVDLLNEKSAMGVRMQQLTHELQAVQDALESLHGESAVVRVRLDESDATAKRITQQHRAVTQEHASVAAQMERLVQRVQGLPAAEKSMDDCCGALEALIVEVSALDQCVRAGGDFERFDDVVATAQRSIADKKARAAAAAASSSSSSASEENPSVPTVAISSGRLPVTTAAKSLVRLAQETLNYFRPNLRAFISVKQKQLVEQRRQHGQELENASAEKDRMLAAHAAEVQGVQQRVQELEREIMRIAEGQQRDVQGEAAERLSQLDRLSTASLQMQDEIAKLRDENVQLRLAVKRTKVDFNKVEESRRRFQQLKVECQLLREHAAKVDAENRNLKLFVESMMPHGAGALGPASSAAAAGGVGVGGGFGDAASVAALREQQMQHANASQRSRNRVHKNTFSEWQKAVLHNDDGES